MEAMLSSRAIDQVEVTHMDIFHIFRFSRNRQYRVFNKLISSLKAKNLQLLAQMQLITTNTAHKPLWMR